MQKIEIIKVKGGVITFNNNLKYLGRYIYYSLQDYYDVNSCLAAGNVSIGALHKFWIDTNVDIFSKYLILITIPTNLLLWGYEIWDLHISLIKKLGLLTLQYQTNIGHENVCGKRTTHHEWNSKKESFWYNQHWTIYCNMTTNLNCQSCLQLW